MTTKPTKDDNELLEALRETTNWPMTPELAFQQKVSGIMAGYPMDSTVTREEIEAYVRKREGLVAKS